jgi:hypothetical protein
VPDAVIDMGGNKTTGNDIEAIDINNSAINNFPENYGLIKSQILNELGATSDTSISSTSGNPGFSKTDAGVDALQARLGVSDNDLRKAYELWFGRICETLLNLHFALTQGTKELDLKMDTMKRMKLDPLEPVTMDFDQEYGPITFTVDASTSEASDSKKENEELIGLLELTSKYGGLRPDRQMAIINQIIQNSGVDDAEDLLYTDDEIAQAREMAENPPVEQAREAAPVEGAPVEMPGMPVEEPMPEQLPMPEEVPAPQEEMLTPDEIETVQILQERGLPAETIATAITMLRNDYSDEEVMAVLGGGQ